MFILGWLRFRLNPVLWFPVNTDPLTIMVLKPGIVISTGPAARSACTMDLSHLCHFDSRARTRSPAEGCDRWLPVTFIIGLLDLNDIAD
jgi:hypothetical protein